MLAVICNISPVVSFARMMYQEQVGVGFPSAEHFTLSSNFIKSLRGLIEMFLAPTEQFKIIPNLSLLIFYSILIILLQFKSYPRLQNYNIKTMHGNNRLTLHRK